MYGVRTDLTFPAVLLAPIIYSHAPQLLNERAPTNRLDCAAFQYSCSTREGLNGLGERERIWRSGRSRSDALPRRVLEARTLYIIGSGVP